MTMTFGYDEYIAIGNACPVFEAAIGPLRRAYGDGADADERRTAALVPLVLALRHSSSDDAGAKRRGFAMADLARRWAARAFDAAGLPVQAAGLRGCEPIVDARTAKAAEAVAERVAPTPRAGELSVWAAAHATWAVAWAARGASAGRGMRSAQEAARHAADAATYAADAVALAAKSAGPDLDTIELCIADLIALVQRETGRAMNNTGSEEQ